MQSKISGDFALARFGAISDLPSGKIAGWIFQLWVDGHGSFGAAADDCGTGASGSECVSGIPVSRTGKIVWGLAARELTDIEWHEKYGERGENNGDYRCGNSDDDWRRDGGADQEAHAV